MRPRRRSTTRTEATSVATHAASKARRSSGPAALARARRYAYMPRMVHDVVGHRMKEPSALWKNGSAASAVVMSCCSHGDGSRCGGGGFASSSCFSSSSSSLSLLSPPLEEALSSCRRDEVVVVLEVVEPLERPLCLRWCGRLEAGRYSGGRLGSWETGSGWMWSADKAAAVRSSERGSGMPPRSEAVATCSAVSASGTTLSQSSATRSSRRERKPQVLGAREEGASNGRAGHGGGCWEPTRGQCRVD